MSVHTIYVSRHFQVITTKKWIHVQTFLNEYIGISKAFVEFDQISFFEFVPEDATLLQINNFHNY